MLMATDCSDILDQLRPHGLEHWRTVCFDLLDHTSGLEAYLADPNEHPLASVRTAILSATKAPHSADETLVSSLAAMPLFDYRVSDRAHRHLWHPLTETFSAFSSRHFSALWVWRDWYPYPTRADVTCWLRERLPHYSVTV
jgi:hypothetical protein